MMSPSYSICHFLKPLKISVILNKSLPLSIYISGVCTNVLKKICHDNGLVRWPHRKFLSGKSVEEIKRDAARERNMELAELSKATGERNGSSEVSSSLGPQLQNKTLSSVQELSNSRGITTQQQGNKNVQNGRPQNSHCSSLAKGTQVSLDEFKYGFPSDGLSIASYRWWGSNGPDHTENIRVNGVQVFQEHKHQSKELGDDGACSLSENGIDESNTGALGSGLLSAVRKRAVDGGGDALKLGVYRRYGINKLGRRERTLLLRIFKFPLQS
ncbi:uncharacterized protein LOC132311158 isoform X2 [Cornus florida]|uniref:uncharacterized protein LOC132311158 isoform X2 n=1 Tax=Cornus florida TaxID=4283 RepID=UPI002896D4F1|nr:uncharacterized protein LOC132311158 isoform X2 [Cornus florida]